MDFNTHSIPFTIPVNSGGLPLSLMQFQICSGIRCPEELNMLVHHIYPWQTIPGYRIQKYAQNACIGIKGQDG